MLIIFFSFLGPKAGAECHASVGKPKRQPGKKTIQQINQLRHIIFLMLIFATLWSSCRAIMLAFYIFIDIIYIAQERDKNNSQRYFLSFYFINNNTGNEVVFLWRKTIHFVKLDILIHQSSYSVVYVHMYIYIICL